MKLFNSFLKKVAAVALGIVAVALPATTAYAGTDLTASCPAFGVCAIVPAGVPLLNEAGWIPGSTVTQRFSVTDTSAQSGFVAVEVINYTETKNLGEVIDIEIHRDSLVGPMVYGNVTLHDFRDDGYFTIDGITAGQTKDYYLVATMQPSAGNEYQAANVEFDLRLGLEVAPIPPTSGGGDGSGNSGSGTGGTSPASPPVCNDQAPSSASSLTVTSVGTNTVSLSWTPVNPVTHYALVFTRTSDGAQYGSTNIGNVTTFTVQNLSGGANYTFEVFGVNGCAPGPRSNKPNTGNVPGPFIGGRPTGGGLVLGTTTESPSPSPSPSPSASPTTVGEVAGITTSCEPWRMYVPWILLVLQALIIAAVEYYFRKDTGYTKYFLVAGTTLLSIFLFYILRSCPCYETNALWILVWLCKWYWLVALILSLLLRLFSYAFVEEVEEKRAATSVMNKTTLADAMEKKSDSSEKIDKE